MYLERFFDFLAINKNDPIMTQNDPKLEQKVQSCYAILVNFATDFVDWNDENGEQGNSLLSNTILRKR